MPETKEWTLMFYFASDNPLAISVVSQLKAIKAAGFHPEANVVAQFDPFTEGTPTHVFDVNLINKLIEPEVANIGFFENVPIVRNMIEDKLWGEERTNPTEESIAAGENPQGELVRTALHDLLEARHGIDYNPPLAPFGVNGFLSSGAHEFEEPDPETSLSEFLKFCADNYPARHYILFMLGHGVVVGNDIFMFDEHAASENSLTLTDLGRILRDFQRRIEPNGGEFEMISFQSCSVSSVEVAFELQGTANYMLASQGPTFVGSWPYRQILIRIFNELNEHGGELNVREMMLTIYNYCLRNSVDYLLAGYSFQATLCDLTKISRLKQSIEDLAFALVAGLGDLTAKDFILLSHWKSQSFFNEIYTDLYDFCFCFVNKVKEFVQSGGSVTPALQAIFFACEDIMDKLVKENPKRAGDPQIEQILVGADSLGPAFQYSRGLSVYFPWAEPSHDRRIMAEYENYRFTTDFQGVSWLTFLRAYFHETMRDVSKAEPDPRRFLPLLSAGDTLDEDLASLVYTGEGMLDAGSTLALSKGDPTDKTGADCECASIKNYPRDVRSRRARRRQANQQFPLMEGLSLFGTNGQNGNGNH